MKGAVWERRRHAGKPGTARPGSRPGTPPRGSRAEGICLVMMLLALAYFAAHLLLWLARGAPL